MRVKPLLTRFTHNVLLHRVARFFARADPFPFIIARLELLLNVIIVCSREEHVTCHMRLLLKFLKTHNFALPINALHIDLVVVLSWEDLLRRYLRLIIVLHL